MIVMFPFLIGKVLTINWNAPAYIHKRKFPFLIGKVLTLHVNLTESTF